jgi:malonyl-CoA O-methyltransferase
MRAEYLPCTGGAAQEVVLLHGWGCNREVWRPLLRYLRPWANVTLLDLPGCAPGAEPPVGDDPLQDLLVAVLDCVPAQAVYVGWSLGGQLAASMAARFPERVGALVTLCSSPRFVAAPNWPGMDPMQLEEFRAALAMDAGAALRRFDALQVRGAGDCRGLLRELRGLQRQPPGQELGCGLAWLVDLDLRATLPGLEMPQLHLLAERDALVPAAAAAALRALLDATPGASVRSLAGASHVAPLERAADLAGNLREFLATRELLVPGGDIEGDLEKREVAASFSRAAGQYDSVAGLQRDVGTRLLDFLDQPDAAPHAVLDLGCGTGFFQGGLAAQYPRARYIGLDLAEGMVDFARRRGAGTGEWLVGDAEALPLAGESVDLVFSSLAVQWCYRPDHLFAELARILRPGGRCVFTTLGPDTLLELREAWAAVDDYRHVNRFLPAADLVAAAGRLPGLRLRLETERYCMDYQRVGELLSELKTLGAHNMNRDRPSGLTSRRALQGMLRAYEARRRNGVLPATYEVIFGILEKV